MTTLRLRPHVKHYAWGGLDELPRLLGLKNDSREPFAELWWGDHPSGTSSVVREDGSQHPLDLRTFSPPVSKLPFLFKMLDVARPLSLQVHPSQSMAQAGYREEEVRGVPWDAPERKYRDPLGKTEIVVAHQGEFWALCGWRSSEEMKSIFKACPELGVKNFTGSWEETKRVFEGLLHLPTEDSDRILTQLLIKPELKGIPRGAEIQGWARQADQFYSKLHKDRGLFAFYFLNLFHLKAGEGLRINPGTPHLYLKGLAVELMTNSDNVVRAGLTEKPRDVAGFFQWVSPPSDPWADALRLHLLPGADPIEVVPGLKLSRQLKSSSGTKVPGWVLWVQTERETGETLSPGEGWFGFPGSTHETPKGFYGYRVECPGFRRSIPFLTKAKQGLTLPGPSSASGR